LINDDVLNINIFEGIFREIRLTGFVIFIFFLIMFTFN